MRRALIPPGAVRDNTITIHDSHTLRHLLDVLRVKPGDRLECVDGRRYRYAGKVTACSPRQVSVAVEQRLEEPPPWLSITLAQALIKPERFEWVIQKATELGVARLVPLVTARTQARLPADRAAQRLARWRRIAEEATRQCGRIVVPALEVPQPVASFLETMKGRHVLCLTLSQPGRPLAESIADLHQLRDLTIMIGPEGDFSPEEAARAARQGARLVRLGAATLRAETAAMAVLAIVQHAAGVL